jgi:hypothetical protein
MAILELLVSRPPSPEALCPYYTDRPGKVTGKPLPSLGFAQSGSSAANAKSSNDWKVYNDLKIHVSFSITGMIFASFLMIG